MLALIRKNFTLKVLSFVLALLAWAYFNFSSNPLITARFDQQVSIPLTVLGVPSGDVSSVPVKSVLVTITAPRGGVAAVRPDDVHAFVDVSGKGVGIYSLPIRVVGPHLTIKAISPLSVTLSVDRIVNHTYRVALAYSNKPHAGLVVEAPTVEPETVVASGPSMSIGLISTVHVDVPLDAARTSVDAMVRPIAADVDGKAIPGISLTPNLVRVRIPIVKS